MNPILSCVKERKKNISIEAKQKVNWDWKKKKERKSEKQTNDFSQQKNQQKEKTSLCVKYLGVVSLAADTIIKVHFSFLNKIQNQN